MTVKISPPTPSFEDEIRATMTTPQARSEFVDALGAKLMRQSSFVKSATVHRRPARLIWAATLAVLILLIAGLLIIGPQRVLALVGSWFSYVPGVGYVQANATLRILPAPQSVERDGITLTVEQVVADAQHTVILYRVEGIQPRHRPVSEADPGCLSQVTLQLPDGARLTPDYVIGVDVWPTGYRSRAVSPAVPLAVNQLTLLVTCFNDTKSGTAPENWEIALSLAPAPANFDVRPVVEIPTGQIVPTAVQTTDGLLISPQNVQFTAERIVELDNGYQIEGSFLWQGNGTVYLGAIPSQTEPFKLVDAAGQDIPVGAVEPDMTAISAQDHSRTWAVRTNTKDVQSPLTLSLQSLSVMQPVTASFDLDLGASPQSDHIWMINRDVDIAGRSMHVVSAALLSKPDGNYVIELSYKVNSDEIVFLGLQDPNNHSARPSVGGRGGGGRFTTADIFYDYLPTGVRHVQVNDLIYTLKGPWVVSLNLPKTSTPAATHLAPQATCLTVERWQHVKAQPPAPLPAGVNGRILVAVAGPVQAGMTYPTLYVANLDGSQKVEIGPGLGASLSPDGKRVTYTYSDGMHLVDLDTGRNTLLQWSQQNDNHPVWSPDGKRIAFNRDGVYTANLDGGDLRKVRGSTVSSALAGWMPDGVHLAVTTLGSDGSQLQTVNAETGAVENRFLIDNRKSRFVALSPDGKRVAFSEMLFGRPAYGLYVANLDGTGKRLVASAGADVFAVIAVTAAWSPDGEWLLVSGFELNSGSTVEEWSGFVVQPDTCQVDHLPEVDGEVSGWR